MAQDFNWLARCEGFDWDEHNEEKIWEKHRVSSSESEQLFFNRPLVMAEDREHSEQEARFYALGQTDAGRKLFMVFTIRGDRIRMISARDMTRKERQTYAAREEEDSKVSD